ncbi:MAG: hypothetical protein EBU90_19240 [Proteobacteria bacterium]|nr:hypothetical protein [Pseudomonadota bacterium]NBP14468.1 hypothetical protein [bacterium]
MRGDVPFEPRVIHRLSEGDRFAEVWQMHFAQFKIDFSNPTTNYLKVLYFSEESTALQWADEWVRGVREV